MDLPAARGLLRPPGVLALLAAAIALLYSSLAPAAPRAPPPRWKDPSGPPTEADVWQRRLVGRYRVEGMIQVLTPPTTESSGGDVMLEETVDGMADCVAVGAGPGVQCVLNIAWLDMFQIIYPSAEGGSDPTGVFNVPGGVSYMNPSMALFGLDPGSDGMKYLLVDNKGLPEGGLGATTGNRGTFRTECVNAPTLFNAMIPTMTYRTCDRILRIDARPDSSLVHLLMEIEINEDVRTRAVISLRRMAVQDGLEPGMAP